MEQSGQDNQQPSRPLQVRAAVYLIYASLAVTILHALINPAAVGQGETEFVVSPFLYLACAIAILFPIFLTIYISAGRNWARQLYSVGVFLNFFYAADLLQNFDDYPLITILGTIPLLLQIAAIILLFQGPSNTWFKSDKAAAKTEDELDKKPAARKGDKLPLEGVASSGSIDNKARDIPLVKYVAIAAAAGAGIGLMNALFWATTLPPESQAEQEFVYFLILAGFALGAAWGAVSGLLFLQFARRNPNRTPALWAVMGGVLGGVFSFGCCFFMTALSFV
jgi:hypothetical protein